MLVCRTSRLNLRWATREDAEFFVELMNDPDWIRFTGDRGILGVDEAREYELPRVYAITDPENLESIRLLERCGLRFERMLELSGDESELKLFVGDLTTGGSATP